jgi:hypothetical protein
MPTARAAHGAERSWRTVLPFIVGIACFAALAVLNEARGFTLWRNYALSGIALGSPVTWLLWRLDVRVPAYMQWVIVVGLLLHYGGGSMGGTDPYHMGLLGLHGVNGAYHEWTWWDNLTHGVGLGAGAMAVAYLAEAAQLRRGLAWPGWAVGALAFIAALAAGVGVELYEYLGKSAFQTIDQGGYANTMRDLHFNVLGAALGAAIAVLLDRRRFASRIQAHWGRPGATLAGQPWTRRVPPILAGFAAFSLPPALATLALGLRFFLQAPPADDAAAYDAALQVMLWSAVAGIVAGPLAALLARRSGASRPARPAPSAVDRREDA